MQGRIVQLNVSPGGIPKLSVGEAYCSPLGLEGDGHDHPRFHGGPQKALLLLSLEDLETLKEAGYPLFPGALGENLTVAGIDFRQLRAGQRWRAGGAVLELTTVRQPCRTLDPYTRPGLQPIQEALYDQDVKRGDPRSPRWARGGFYAAVSQAGWIRPGDTILLLDQLV